MPKAGEYKPAKERGWREQSLPDHPKLDEIKHRIAQHLASFTANAPLKLGTSLSDVVEAAVNYAYTQWIEHNAEYPQTVNDDGIQLYAVVSMPTERKADRKESFIYLKEATVDKIEAIGAYLETVQLYVPKLHSTRWKNRYNRKLIIVLCMNALAASLTHSPKGEN